MNIGSIYFVGLDISFFVLIIALGLFIFLSILFYSHWQISKRKAEENLGRLIEDLQVGVVYYQSTFPDNLIFLSEGDDILPKAYSLDFNVENLPNTFMVIEEDGRKKIIVWDPEDIYEKTITPLISIEDTSEPSFESLEEELSPDDSVPFDQDLPDEKKSAPDESILAVDKP